MRDAKTIGQQVAMMQRCFPGFRYRRRNCPRERIPTWVGWLQPFGDSVAYQVKVEYRVPKQPQVWVIQPQLRPNTPHLYHDGSLCLYYPPDMSWHPSKLIATTILPWTAHWLGVYDCWCVTNQWCGPEAPHRRRKLR
ncbi:MAG: hypothetical protein U0X20_31170 [Caldilineaceae bacterium]